MTRLRKAVVLAVLAGVTAVTGLVGTSPASASAAAPEAAAAATCYYRDYDYVNSGVSEADVWLDYCTDGSSAWYEISGEVYDISCDNRTAYLDIIGNNGQSQRASASGCGNSNGFAFRYNTNLGYADLRTRACGSGLNGCSSSDWGSVST
jgi:hypothetical protein